MQTAFIQKDRTNGWLMKSSTTVKPEQKGAEGRAKADD